MCHPLINAPMFGVITTRTPPALLPKVMTAIITLATVAGPLGLLVAGLRCSSTRAYGDVRDHRRRRDGVWLLFIVLITRFRRREAGEAATAAG